MPGEGTQHPCEQQQRHLHEPNVVPVHVRAGWCPAGAMGCCGPVYTGLNWSGRGSEAPPTTGASWEKCGRQKSADESDAKLFVCL